MRRWLRLGLTVMAVPGCVAGAACGFGGGAAKVSIPAGITTANAEYTLLYSTLGYESAATKRVLIRQNDTVAPASQGLAFSWRLVDTHGSQVDAGRATYAGDAWTIPLWAADFSKVHKAGEYRMLVETPGIQLATDPFPIDEFLLFKTTYSAVALDNADARAAPIEMDNGYFSGNDRSGSVGSHANFLVGLLESFDRRRASLTDDERKRALAAIDRAADYLFLLGDPSSGEIAGQSSTRPNQDFDPSTTAAGLRGLAHYAALAKSDEPEKANRAYRRAQLAEEWLLANAPAAYPPSLQAAVDYDLYRFAQSQATLDSATKAVRAAVSSYDLRTMDRRSGDTLPHFEAMYGMWRDLRSHPDRAFWERTAQAAAAQYHDMINRNVFQMVPPGVTDAQEGTSAPDQWDQVATLPLPGDSMDAVIGNDWIMARAIDAVYLSEITGDVTLEKVATASLTWVTGLNPGVSSTRVVGASGGSPYEAASFLTGVRARQVEPAPDWQWQRPKPFATIVNGFRGRFVFDDSAAAGGTSIHHDGLWLYASAVYEDNLNPGKRPPQLGTTGLFEQGIRVTDALGRESATALSLFVTVAGPNGTAVEGAKVTVAWSGAQGSAVSPDEAVRLTACVTLAGGSCAATLDARALPGSRPISAAVTNVEDPVYAYDVTRAPAPVSFP